MEDLLAALGKCVTKIDVKRTLHDHGWSNTKAASWVNAVWSDPIPTPVESPAADAIGPRTKMARKMKTIGKRDEYRDGHLKWHLIAMDNSAGHKIRERTGWSENGGYKSEREAWDEVAAEKLQELLPEIEATKNDDELLALLCRRGFKDSVAEELVYFFGPDVTDEEYEKRMAERECRIQRENREYAEKHGQAAADELAALGRRYASDR